MRIEIEVAKDNRTGFPCVRLPDEREFISLFPVTKLQAEEWIYRNGVEFNDPHEYTAFFYRLEAPGTGDQFPKAVRSLNRRPIPQQSSDTLLSVIATNLSVWSADEETHRPDVLFPTPNSEWGRLTRWLGGRIPSYREWWVTLDDLRSIPATDIIQGVLNSRIQWDRVVKDLLWKVKETLPRDAMGLPFMKAGLYELIADREKFKRLVLHHRDECRPQVAGDSPVWPTLNADWDGAESSIYRPLRQRMVPVVAMRLWYAEAEVAGKLPTGEYESFKVEEIQIDEPPAAPRAAPEQAQSRASSIFTSWGIPKQSARANEERKLSAYVAPPEKMRIKCPVCYGQVDPETFGTKADFYCYKELVSATQPDGSVKRESIRKHSVEFPQVGEAEQIPRLYLDVAQTQPGKIHVVALSGFREAGKSTWLLSLGGWMDYPDGNPIIFRAFPKSWDYLHIPCSIEDFTQEKPTERKLWTERVWLDGLLPLRNSTEAKAFRSPIRFIRSLKGREQTILPIFNDQAGDLLIQKRINYENFPHIASTTDALFFLPANGINTEFVQRFISQMQTAREAGFAVDLKKVNLILVISKIDQLKYGDKQERELFDRILPRPYRFPKERDEAGLKAYLEEMYEVHWGIEEWIRKYMPMLEGFTKRFGSVRYCGLSSFGFQPKKEIGMQVESSLPFRPEPVRVVDPVFWLLKENQWMKF